MLCQYQSKNTLIREILFVSQNLEKLYYSYLCLMMAVQLISIINLYRTCIMGYVQDSWLRVTAEYCQTITPNTEKSSRQSGNTGLY
jgi:hypothetical protein